MKKIYLLLIPFAFIACSKGSKKNSPGPSLSGKYLSYRRIDTFYQTINGSVSTSYTNGEDKDDTLNFTSKNSGIYTTPNDNPADFTYDLTTKTFIFQNTPSSLMITDANHFEIATRVYDSGHNLVGAYGWYFSKF